MSETLVTCSRVSDRSAFTVPKILEINNSSLFLQLEKGEFKQVNVRYVEDDVEDVYYGDISIT